MTTSNETIKTVESMLDAAIYFFRKSDPEVTPAAIYGTFEQVIEARRREGSKLLPPHMTRKELRQREV